MRDRVDVDSIIDASKNDLVNFQDIPRNALEIPKLELCNEGVSNQIVERYNRYGFAIVHFQTNEPSCSTVVELADLLHLGDPFIPPLYTKGGYKAEPIATISTKTCSSHPTFQKEVGVKLHCDGTLQGIGYVKTSVLLCEAPASQGGESILFNATAAYAELVRTDLDAAVALATPGSLLRQANMNGCNDKNFIPAFAVEDGKLICAYSVTETDSFEKGFGINPSDLSRGVEFMDRASQPDSPFYYAVRIEANQAIILANNKIAHGRMPYSNSPGTRRCLYRGIFLKYPQAYEMESQLKIAV